VFSCQLLRAATAKAKSAFVARACQDYRKSNWR
jgi:hypothetical protein